MKNESKNSRRDSKAADKITWSDRKDERDRVSCRSDANRTAKINHRKRKRGAGKWAHFPDGALCTIYP